MSWNGGDEGGKEEEEESKPSLAGAGVAAAHSPAFGHTPHF